MMRHPVSSLTPSSQRFSVDYHLAGDEKAAGEKARDICLEQTVEVPDALVPDGMIREQVLGRIEAFAARPEGGFAARISYAVEIAGTDLTQLLNVLFGNISIKAGIRADRLDLPETMLRSFRGPRFGRAGLRALLGAPHRPLLCTALKPLGLSAEGLAELAYRFALGGIEIIKDDHGLADQGFAPFRDRVRLCAQAVQRANRETGSRCIYVPNVTAPFDEICPRARLAKEQGAGGLLVAPGLTGLDAMRCLADDDALALPIFAHPAFQGTDQGHLPDTGGRDEPGPSPRDVGSVRAGRRAPDRRRPDDTGFGSDRDLSALSDPDRGPRSSNLTAQFLPPIAWHSAWA
jgi:ribulose-bisphosphate carboxylase large chain